MGSCTEISNYPNKVCLNLDVGFVAHMDISNINIASNLENKYFTKRI